MSLTKRDYDVREESEVEPYDQGEPRTDQLHPMFADIFLQHFPELRANTDTRVNSEWEAINAK